MSRRPKFKPEITRVRLNPEQAAVTCDCYNEGYITLAGTDWIEDPASVNPVYCSFGGKVKVGVARGRTVTTTLNIAIS